MTLRESNVSAEEFGRATAAALPETAVYRKLSIQAKISGWSIRYE
jgi:hypothetical protein